MGIISGSGSFRGRFGDYFRVGDHFGVGIISGAVQASTYNSSNLKSGVSNLFQRLMKLLPKQTRRRRYPKSLYQLPPVSTINTLPLLLLSILGWVFVNNEYVKKHLEEKMAKMCLSWRFHQLFLSLLYILGYISKLHPLTSTFAVQS